MNPELYSGPPLSPQQETRRLVNAARIELTSRHDGRPALYRWLVVAVMASSVVAGGLVAGLI